LTWDSSDENNPVFLSWHILNGRGDTIRFENARIPFERSVPPGASIAVAVSLSPELGISAGRYIFEFDLVHEDTAWFADKGSPTRRVAVEVLP
jgi:hypothetical protein